MDIVPRENRVLDPWTGVDERLDLEAAMRQLTDKQREALTLWAMGYTQAEIGELVGIGRRSVGHRLEGGVRHLRKLMQ